VQHPVECANCGRSTQTVETCCNLEYKCPWCYKTTIFNTFNGILKGVLARDPSPETLTGEAKHDAFAKMMRQNRGIDTDRC
jgi:hypothetical protein